MTVTDPHPNKVYSPYMMKLRSLVWVLLEKSAGQSIGGGRVEGNYKTEKDI